MRYIADWVLPIATPPVHRGRVDVRDGRVVGVGTAADAGGAPAAVVDLGRAAILPALVNAHTHLELSELRGTVPPAASMPQWVDSLLQRRAEAGPPDPGAIRRAIAEARASGTGLLGDIGNTAAAAPILAKAGMPARLFREVLAFPDRGASAAVDAAASDLGSVAAAGGVRVGMAAHAPFSVGRAAFAALDAVVRERFGGPRSIHLAESPEELEFLRSGSGPWRDLLDRIGRWDPAWTPPRCGPVEYLDRLGWLRAGLVVVHGVQLTDLELRRLAERDVFLVTCPRSNVWTGVGPPPIERFLRAGVPLAVGTDSLASAPDLNLFSELALMRSLAPSAPARRLLACATRHGAEALGFDDEFGTIAPGLRADLIGVRIPAGVGDVEEYLLGGITPDRVTRLDVRKPDGST